MTLLCLNYQIFVNATCFNFRNMFELLWNVDTACSMNIPKLKMEKLGQAKVKNGTLINSNITWQSFMCLLVAFSNVTPLFDGFADARQVFPKTISKKENGCHLESIHLNFY